MAGSFQWEHQQQKSNIFFVKQDEPCLLILFCYYLHVETNPSGIIMYKTTTFTISVTGAVFTLTLSNDKPRTGSISSNLKSNQPGDSLFNAAVDGLETLVLAQACAGIDVSTPAFTQSLESAIESIANNIDEDESAEPAKQTTDIINQTMEDWRICEGGPVEDNERTRYNTELTIGNQIYVEITEENGEPCMGFILEINHGVPALHIDVDGGNCIVHIHKTKEGILLTPDYSEAIFETPEMSKLSYNDPRTLLIKS